MRVTEFAQRVGISRQKVLVAIKNGRIPGNLVKRVGNSYDIPDYVAAEQALRANTDPLPRGNVKDPDARPTIAGPSIAESRAETEAWRAKLARLEYEERLRKLVDAQEVKEEVASLLTRLRALLLGVPAKAKGEIPELTMDNVEVIARLIREALESIADGN